mmetsp:Transcript_30329/g.40507  ORF Transcript_30329/g.40507 Transcript_30329/m.40507 type:complete len:209 (-) Transcript_30329:324-950(-)
MKSFNISKVRCKWCIVERIVPFPRRNSIVVIFHNPTEAHDIRPKEVFTSPVVFNVICLTFVCVVTVLPTRFMKFNIIFNIVGVFIKLLSLRFLDFSLEYRGCFILCHLVQFFFFLVIIFFFLLLLIFIFCCIYFLHFFIVAIFLIFAIAIKFITPVIRVGNVLCLPLRGVRGLISFFTLIFIVFFFGTHQGGTQLHRCLFVLLTRLYS